MSFGDRRKGQIKLGVSDRVSVPKGRNPVLSVPKRFVFLLAHDSPYCNSKFSRASTSHVTLYMSRCMKLAASRYQIKHLLCAQRKRAVRNIRCDFHCLAMNQQYGSSIGCMLHIPCSLTLFCRFNPPIGPPNMLMQGLGWKNLPCDRQHGRYWPTHFFEAC